MFKSASTRSAPKQILLIALFFIVTPIALGYGSEIISHGIGCQLNSIDYSPSASQRCPEALNLISGLGMFGTIFAIPVGAILLVVGLIWLIFSKKSAAGTPENKHLPGGGFVVALLILGIIGYIVWKAIQPL